MTQPSAPRPRAPFARLPRGAWGVEIGVFEGASAALILARAAPRRLWLVDPWAAAHEPERAGALYAADAGRDMEAVLGAVRARFAAEIARGQVEILRGTAADADPRIADASLGFVHIDGDHRAPAVEADFDFARRKLRPGGIALLDDYHLGGWWGDGVHRGAHAALGRHPAAFEIAGAPEGTLLLRRR